ncbi:MAG: M13 family peptidase, partial [Acidobacteria bacterium]
MRLLTLMCALVTISVVCVAQDVPAPADNAMPKLEHFSPDQVDKSLGPCTDFFEYACRKWLKANPIPPDQAGWGTFNALTIWNVAAVRNTLEQASAPSASRTAVEQKVGDYYASCMDEATINKAGVAPVQPVLDRIAKLQDKSQLPELIAYIHQNIRPANLNFIDAQYQGVLFGIFAWPDFDNAKITLATLDQSGMNMPSREFYLKDDEKSKQIREKYLKHVARMLELSGEPAQQATAEAPAILRMETDLANAAMDIVARRDPKNQNNKMSLQQVQALTPSFDWSRYFGALPAPASPQYLVLAPEFFKGMEKLIASEPVDHLRAYLRYSSLHFLAPYLGQTILEENFDFYARTLFGSPQIQPRWRRCAGNADADMGEAVGQAYVKKYFPPENKE